MQDIYNSYKICIGLKSSQNSVWGFGLGFFSVWGFFNINVSHILNVIHQHLLVKDGQGTPLSCVVV